MVAVDVLAGLAEQILVVDAFEVVPAGAFDRSHGSSLGRVRVAELNATPA
jgi:hypothetical protein